MRLSAMVLMEALEDMFLAATCCQAVECGASSLRAHKDAIEQKKVTASILALYDGANGLWYMNPCILATILR